MSAAAALFLETLELHGEFYEIDFITQLKIEFLLLFTSCRKVLGRMPDLQLIFAKKASYSFRIVFFFHADVLGILQLLQSLIPADFIALRVRINFTSAAFGSTRKHMCMRFRKKIVCSHELPFCVAI